MSSIADSRKKRGRPITGIGPAIGLRLYPELEAALDAYVAGQPDPKPSRPEAIRRVVAASLKSNWKTREEGIQICRSVRSILQEVIKAFEATPDNLVITARLLDERDNLDRVLATYERDLRIGDP